MTLHRVPPLQCQTPQDVRSRMLVQKSTPAEPTSRAANESECIQAATAAVRLTQTLSEDVPTE